MTTYNTGNAIGSTDPRDLYDNAQNLDTAMHTPETTWTDRLGNARQSWAGATGYQQLGDYAAGIQVTTYNQVIRASGEYWRAAAGTALPYTTTGAGMPESGKFVSVGDAILRADLVAAGGSDIVGFQQAGAGAAVRTAQDKMREWVSVKDFGAVGDGVANDQIAIQNAVNYASTAGIREVWLGAKHMIASTVSIPLGVVLRGQGRGCFIYPSASGSYTQGFLFLVNSTDGLTWTTAFPGFDSGGIENVNFRNGDTAATPIITPLRGVRGFGSCIFRSIRGRNMTQMVVRGNTGIYSDNFVAEDIYCEPVIGAEYQVDLQGLGDGAKVSRLHFPYNAFNPGAGTPLGLRISGSLGVRVGECIGGDVFLTRSKVLIESGHYERARITIDNANVDIKSTYISPSDRLPLVIQNSDTQDCQVTLDSVEFAYLSGLLEWSGNDIRLGSSVNLEVKNCYRRYIVSGSIDKNQLHGIRVENNSGVALTAWNDYSYALSRQGRIYRGLIVDQTFSVPSTGNTFQGVALLAADPTETWAGASGTYYYNAQYILDIGRLVGRNGTNGEASVALTSGGNGSRFTIQYGSRPPTGILRVYRGTAAGYYTSFVDIPMYSGVLFYDSGTKLNGFEWQSRVASGVDTLNGLGESFFELKGGRAIFTGAATPTVGIWSAADEIFRVAPAAGGTRAWVCTTAGTPGTWKTFGSIAS